MSAPLRLNGAELTVEGEDDDDASIEYQEEGECIEGAEEVRVDHDPFPRESIIEQTNQRLWQGEGQHPDRSDQPECEIRFRPIRDQHEQRDGREPFSSH